jgi:hypothetical protein
MRTDSMVYSSIHQHCRLMNAETMLKAVLFQH